MAKKKVNTDEIVAILRERGVDPYDHAFGPPDDRITGELGEDETVYGTSLKDVLGMLPEDDPGGSFRDEASAWDDPRLGELWERVRSIIESIERGGPDTKAGISEEQLRNPPEPHCAWYQPVHYFGHDWGIYIREVCLFGLAAAIAHFVDWRAVHHFHNPRVILPKLLVSAFYSLYLHEHFHHKVESFGFRLLVAKGGDCYRNYDTKVYRKAYLTPDCLEESLANSESCRRLREPHYARRVDAAIVEGLREYLRASFRCQPPGYREGADYIKEAQYRPGLHRLLSQVMEASLTPVTPARHWTIAPNVIASLMSIQDEIYVVLPIGAKPILPLGGEKPGFTASTERIAKAITKHHGYSEVPGGKGSHVKFTKPGAPNIHLPGNRKVLSPGAAKHVLNTLGGYPLSRLPDFLAGKLA